MGVNSVDEVILKICKGFNRIFNDFEGMYLFGTFLDHSHSLFLYTLSVVTLRNDFTHGLSLTHSHILTVPITLVSYVYTGSLYESLTIGWAAR